MDSGRIGPVGRGHQTRSRLGPGNARGSGGGGVHTDTTWNPGFQNPISFSASHYQTESCDLHGASS